MAAMSVSQLAEEVKKDPELAAKIKADPVGALSEKAYVSDPKFYRMAIGGLIAIILLVVIGGFITELWTVGPKEPKKALPDGLLALGTTALGVLGGLFISSPTDR
jgi:hypothetical protein